ncbi:MAG: SdiA-regulated domain-containing protein [Bacteroidota bacterium]
MALSFKKPLIAFFVFFIFVALFISCNSNTESKTIEPKIILSATYPLEIKQPSGITFNHNYSMFWIIDGEEQRIYKADLNGNKLSRLAFKGEDLEGIFYNRSDSTLWVVEEETREVIHLDLNGFVISRHSTNISGTTNNGLEGIVLDENNNIYVLNEKDPSQVIALDENFNVAHQFGLPFADDLSDMDYNPITKYFFIVSDESKAIYIWKPGEGLLNQFSLPFTKTEGITVNPTENKIVIVNDSLDTLYEYELITNAE